MVLIGTSRDLVGDPLAQFPPEVEFILSALEAAAHDRPETERAHERIPYRVRAALRLYRDDLDAPPTLLYTRDVSPRALGFITPHRLPLGYGGIVELPAPGGQLLRIDCTLYRCREAVPGWFEGSMYFNRPQHHFLPDPT